MHENENLTQIFDIIIVGAGSAGLYTGWYLQILFPKIKILIVEKNDRIGGRVKSICDDGIYYEAGAGRISSKNKILLSLIDHFKLELSQIDSDYEYVDSDNGNKVSYSRIIYRLTVILGQLNIIATILGKKYLISTTISKFAKKYLTDQDYIDLLKFCPYYSEIHIENAYYGLKSLNSFAPFHQFYLLPNGYSQIFNIIYNEYTKFGGKIIFNNEIVKIKSNNGIVKSYSDDHSVYHSKYIIITGSINQIPTLNHINAIMDRFGISTQPLLRIYAKYPVDIDKKTWFDNITRTVTNNPLRLIIPIDSAKGIIMISYTDGPDAKWWLSKLNNQDKLYKTINKLVSATFRSLKIPSPIWIKPYYWQYGGNFVKPNNYGLTIKSINCLKTPNNVYFVMNHTNWVEGSLRLSLKVINNLVGKLSKNAKY